MVKVEKHLERSIKELGPDQRKAVYDYATDQVKSLVRDAIMKSIVGGHKYFVAKLQGVQFSEYDSPCNVYGPANYAIFTIGVAFNRHDDVGTEESGIDGSFMWTRFLRGHWRQDLHLETTIQLDDDDNVKELITQLKEKVEESKPIIEQFITDEYSDVEFCLDDDGYMVYK